MWLGTKTFNAASKTDIAITCTNIIAGDAIQITQRHGGNPYPPSASGLQEGLANHLCRIRHRGPIQIFVQSTDENSLPEALDAVLRLRVSAQPTQERLAFITRSRRYKSGHGGSNGDLVLETQTGCFKKRRRGVKRSRQSRGTYYRRTSSRFKKYQIVKPADAILYLQAPIELNEIGAATEQNMLAIVDDLSCTGMLVR